MLNINNIKHSGIVVVVVVRLVRVFTIKCRDITAQAKRTLRKV